MKTIMLKISEEEKTEIEGEAKKCSLPLATFIRFTTLQKIRNKPMEVQAV